MYIYIYLSYFAVYLKPTQHCNLNLISIKKKKKREQKTGCSKGSGGLTLDEKLGPARGRQNDPAAREGGEEEMACLFKGWGAGKGSECLQYDPLMKVLLIPETPSSHPQQALYLSAHQLVAQRKPAQVQRSPEQGPPPQGQWEK